MARKSKRTVEAPAYVLGIDIAKATFAVALRQAQGKIVASEQFANAEAGFKQLRTWLQQHKARQVHACLAATGRYGEGLAYYLHAQGYQVSIVNPARIHAYGQSKLQRNKTDRQDARLIADFCATQQPELWAPPPPEQGELHDLSRRLHTLKQMRQQERNRLASGVVAAGARRSIAETIAFLDRQIAQLEDELDAHTDTHPTLKEQVDLLDSIPGIGPITAYALVGELPDITNFRDASQLAAHAGLTPAVRCSGSSVRSKTTLSKKGNARLRAALYMPAITARRCSPAFRTFADRLAANGKSKMSVIGAVMHKLIRIIYAVLKSGKPFDPNHYLALSPS
jgi:transposase